MNKHVEKAMEIRNETPMVNNCAQTILRAYADELGITGDMAAKLSANFGGGMKCGSICGALLGWVLPYWFLFGHAFFYNQMELFYRPFTELVTFGKPFDLQILQPWELAVLGYLLVLFIVSAAHCIIAGFEDKIRTRAYLQFLIDLNIFLFLLIALQPTYCANLLPLLMISSSILIGHFFVLTNSKTSNVFFIISLVSLILLFSFNIWTLL